MNKITPFLWVDGNVKEMLQFYTSVFTNSQVVGTPPRLMLEGQELILFDGGSHFQLSPAFSLFVNCQNQQEIDDLWEKLTADGGQPSQCGWLTDKYGISWQLVPSMLVAYLRDPNPVKAKRVRDAMLQMGKLEIEILERAYQGA